MEIIHGSYYTDSTLLYSAIAEPNVIIKTKKEIPYPHLHSYMNHKFPFTIPLVKSKIILGQVLWMYCSNSLINCLPQY